MFSVIRAVSYFQERNREDHLANLVPYQKGEEQDSFPTLIHEEPAVRETKVGFVACDKLHRMRMMKY